MEQKQVDGGSPLKSLLNSPLRNVPAVPVPDWSASPNMGPPLNVSYTVLV